MSFAVVFPGQGSQSIGMLSTLAAAFPIVQESFQEASDALGMDVWRLTQEGPEEQLNATEHTQPALLAAGIAVWRVWQQQGGVESSCLAGHSLGEYSALVASGALAFDDALQLVAERGRQMQLAVPAGAGAMAAVLGLDDAQVAEICDAAAQGDILSPANYNSPGQVVIAGTAAAVDRAIELAKQAGAKRALKLSVSVPSHCELMSPAADALRPLLQSISISAPNIPVLHNVDVSEHNSDSEIRQALLQQLYSPVRWVETIAQLKDRGITRVLEFGPGKVLTGLNKRIDRQLNTACVFDPASLEQAIEETAA